ncbi:peptidoglycan-binding domain-containing protein [Gluconacetobacter asukensis]|uniref:Peptidoglycan-binding protein n=1 Tax=Gluconacetobacter asukensis TaxID=1017181 RepID=A0A7W4P051_9PROT|nr:peptidoglycan-binding protein [Gluconacetobacter asukensis]MBB2172736.1 peptidoglycan-binding protein [Gluconacetobacter asukensis]
MSQPFLHDAATGHRLAVSGLLALVILSLGGRPAHAASTIVPALAEASLGDRARLDLAAGGLTASITLKPSTQCGAAMAWQPADPNPSSTCRIATLSIRAKGQARPASFPLAPYGQDAGFMDLRVSIQRLDATSAVPQIMVSAYTGGAHCCEVTSIFGRGPDGQWVHADLGMQDGGGPPAIVAVPGAHDPVIVTYDQAFLYTFASHAGSFTPVILYRYHDGELTNVSDDPAYRSYLVEDLAKQTRQWEASGRSEPNGYLAYYVATRARLGQLSVAWAHMLPRAQNSTKSGFGVSPCSLKSTEETANGRYCSKADRTPLPFPQGLAAFLTRNDYISAAQARALLSDRPATGAGSAPSGPYHPDFPCAPPPAGNGVATMLCQDSEAARHELMFDQVYYALRHQVGQDGWKDLRQQVVLDETTANQSCGLPAPGDEAQAIPPNGAACYADAMDRLAAQYRVRLSGAALMESQRPLDRHIALQKKLAELGLLPADTVVDGVYGEATRAAITAWQQAANRPRTDGFLSDDDAAMLIPPPQAATTPAISAPPPPMAATANVPPQAPTAPQTPQAQAQGGSGLPIKLVFAIILAGLAALIAIRVVRKRGGNP